MSQQTDLRNQELTVDGTTSFPVLNPGDNDIVVKIGEMYSEVTGVGFITGSAPAATTGTLKIQQSVDGGNYDHEDTFNIQDGGPAVSFSIRIIARYIRVQMEVPVGTTMNLRLGGILKMGT